MLLDFMLLHSFFFFFFFKLLATNFYSFNAGLLRSGACISLFMIVDHLKVLIFEY